MSLTSKQVYEALLEDARKLRKMIQEQAKVLFSEASVALFESQPKLIAFSWAQYTPYFNDGEECTFGARTDDPDMQFGDETELSDYYFYPYDGWGANRKKKEITPEQQEKYDAQQAIITFLQAFGDDQLKTMFGDHVEITVRRTDGQIKTSADSYDHD